jgi:adenosylmethionine-8-amino-7-oxononanoate aminotransferase
VIVAPGVAEPFWTTPGGPTFDHGLTYSGHPVCCAAALANIDVLERDGLVERTRAREGAFHATLSSLEGHPLVAEVRGGVGLMAAVALEPERVEADPDLPRRLWAAAREQGLLTRWVPAGVAVAPPLVIEDSEVDEIVGHLERALATL